MLAVLIGTSGCVTPEVYYMGTKDREIKFQEVHIAHDGDVLAVGQLIQRSGSYRRYAYKDRQSLHRYLHVEPHGEADTIQVEGSMGKLKDVTSWQVIPPDFRDDNATEDQLPAKFQSGAHVYLTANPVPYDDEGHTYYLQFHGIAGLGKERASWSYPCQILLLPAGAIDLAFGVVWVPIWLTFFSHVH